MTFDEVYRTLPDQGWLTEPEAKLLWEIGTYCGRSTIVFPDTCRYAHLIGPVA